MYWDIIVQVSGSNYTTTDVSSNPPDITGLSIALNAGSTYEFEAILLGNGSDTAGCRIGMRYSVAGATGAWISIGSTTNTGATAIGGAFGTASGGIWTQGASSDETAHMRGIIITGANSGNLIAQANKVSTGTATVYIGSLLQVKLVG